MTITEYLIELEEELRFLPKTKRNSTLIVYREKINNMLDYGEDETKIIESLPLPKDIAKDLYESEGIDYLEKRKKQAKEKDITKAVMAALMIVLLFSATIVLSWFIIGSIVKVVKLIFLVKGILEVVLNTCLVCAYIAVLIFVYIYLLDLLHLIFNMLMELVLIPFNKNPKFLNYSLTDLIDKVTKKPKLLGKALGISAGVLLLFLLICYFTQTYFYRSVTNEKSIEYVDEIDLTNYNNITKFIINVDTANIILTNGETFNMTVFSEFERTNLIEESNGILSFTTDTLKEFDMFGLFSEPAPYIEISIPKVMSLDIDCTNGTIQMKDMIIEELDIKSDYGNIIIYDTTINNLNLMIEKGGIALNTSNFNKALIESRSGEVELLDNNGIDLEYINGNAGVTITNTTLDTLKLTSDTGNVFINNLTNKETTVELQSCTLDLKKINSENSINLKAMYESSVTLYESNTNTLDVGMNSGTFTGYYLTMSGKIISTGSVMLSYITGSFDVECLGGYCDIYEAIGETFKVTTQGTETTLKYIKAETIDYSANNSKTLLYFVFGKTMKVIDERGDIHFDNDQSICDDLTLYSKYQQNIERLTITPGASYRVNDGVILGDVE